MNMMKITNVLVAGLLLLCVACSKSEKQTPSGLKFTIVKAGDGVLPKTEEILVFEYTIKDSKDSVWQSTYESGFPGAVKIADSANIKTEIGMQQMFRMLSKGDSAYVTLPTKQFFKDVLGGPLAPGADTTLNMSCHVKVVNIMKDEASFREFQKELGKKREGTQKAKDATTIKNYLAENKIDAKEDTSGIHYVIYNTTGGQKPTAESCVTVKYTGKFMKDGQIFDKNDKVGFSLNRVIPGWRISIPMIGVGDSATFYIPSGLAYGPQGFPGAIPPDAILIFNVHLLGVAATYDEATNTCK